jgi:hypothetical protein
MKHKLRWDDKTREAFLDGEYLSPKKSQAVYNHSPDGFNVGYNGSGPAQLALAVCLELMPKINAVYQYQNFKREVIATMPQHQDSEVEFEMEDKK